MNDQWSSCTSCISSDKKLNLAKEVAKISGVNAWSDTSFQHVQSREGHSFERDASLLLHIMSNPPPPAPVPDDELDEVLLHCTSHSPSGEITIILIHGACVSGRNLNPIVTYNSNKCRSTCLPLYPKIQNMMILLRSFFLIGYWCNWASRKRLDLGAIGETTLLPPG
jgi:hypothetical protein